jgi:TPR repeat protein
MRKIIFTVLCLIASFSFSSAFADADELKSLIEEFEGGSKYAAYNLGVKYGSGEGVKQNLSISNKYYEYAAKKNYAPAQNNLGWSYRQGIGLRKDSIKAIYWFRLAAIQHNTLALQNLAEMFEAGEC